jgi:hypothetical protein
MRFRTVSLVEDSRQDRRRNAVPRGIQNRSKRASGPIGHSQMDVQAPRQKVCQLAKLVPDIVTLMTFFQIARHRNRVYHFGIVHEKFDHNAQAGNSCGI